jgi:hypothetical protein
MLPMFSEKKIKEENVDFLSKTNKHLLIEEKENNTMLCFAIIFGRDTKKQENKCSLPRTYSPIKYYV